MLQPSTSPSRRWLRMGLVLAAALMLVLLVLLVWLGQQSLRAPAAPAGPPPTQQAGWTLVQDQYCLRCHGMVQTHVGPGFAQIAQRYRGDATALAQLTDRIQHGSAGRWGRKLMPRNPRINAEDAQAMAAWVLSQPDPPAQ